MSKILLATRNKDKVDEFKHALQGLPYEVLTALDFPTLPEVDEDQDTLEGNAFKKARMLYEATGIFSMADDTGLEVSALNGQPGVYSARYAGKKATYAENRAKMLREMMGEENRTAQFRTVIAYYTGKKKFFEGICSGQITHGEIGAGGFGYDPIFMPNGYDVTFAQMTTEEKNKISHRGVAFRKFLAFLANEATRWKIE
ncbi:MAG: RdgB/HAM1 family non-canonical purine NTP pyrophosphatase [Bacteroidetes Order II. Incertae sedis bacterium]|nr:RdgB/HAM1 family non-canonical purine NTP pyrophosphatase [Bacteroidetes Order II. bacterium]